MITRIEIITKLYSNPEDLAEEIHLVLVRKKLNPVLIATL
jgi:hypothetical protein